MSSYIITEDSMSGEKFWSAINKNILHSHFIVRSADGIKNVINIINELIESGKISHGDKLIVAYDNIGNYDVLNTVERIHEIRIKYKIHIIETTYYCFEEVILSFDSLLDWVKTKNSRMNETKEIVDYIRKCIERQTDYSEYIKIKYETFLLKALDIPRDEYYNLNREQLASKILFMITRQDIGFKVNKYTLGICWIDDCCELEKHILNNPNTKVTKFIRKCGLENEITAYDKIYQIAQNSVFDRGKIKLGDLEHLVLNHKI